MIAELIEDIQIQGKNFKIVKEDIGIDLIEENRDSMSQEEKLRSFLEKVPSFDAFKKYIIQETEEYWQIRINNVVSSDISIFQPNIECLLIQDLILNPRYRNVGIGSKVLSYIERFAKEKGYKCVALAVIARIDPLNFWLKNGFVAVDNIDRDFLIPILQKLNDIRISIYDEDASNHFIGMKKEIK